MPARRYDAGQCAQLIAGKGTPGSDTVKFSIAVLMAVVLLIAVAFAG
jgi:hypothetical protein